MKYKVFKAGKYPQGEFSIQDVKEIAASYDTAYHKAPLTLDHAQKGPAQGWVSNVSADDSGNLFVEFDKLSNEVIELTRLGKYKKPSIEIANYAGKKYLRAVSLVNFPEVKGLPEVHFSDNTSIFFAEDLNISFNKFKTSNSMNPNLIKFFEKLGISCLDESAAVLSLQSKFDELTAKETALLSEVASLKSENESLKGQVETKTKKFAEDKINSLISAGKALPAEKDYLTKMFMSDPDGFSAFAENLPVRDIMKTNTTGTKSPSANDVKDKKFFHENGKPLTYADILKDPKLQVNFSEDEIASLRADY